MKYLFVFLISIILFTCASSKELGLKYSANSDAIDEYHKGWVQIMDEGRYGEAEVSYRKVLEYDPDFLVGKSVLARLTLDIDERIELYKELQEGKEKINGDERLILDVYIAFVKYTNLRDQKSSETKSALQEALQIAERNLKKIVHKYPKEVYLKAEYIEILNSLYGPKRALDSLHIISTESQKENPFLLGFAASMHAELEEFDIAMEKANRLLEVVNDSTQPKTFAVLAEVYFKMENLKIAKSNADRACQLDPRNLDASRLKTKIDAAIQEETPSKSDDIK
ncbi:MAG: hypothetical protein AB8B59_15740 [Maribacter sp.]